MCILLCVTARHALPGYSQTECVAEWHVAFAGPVTILNWSFPRKDITRQAQAFQLALAIREEVADLEKAGCKVIQVSFMLPPVWWYFATWLVKADGINPQHLACSRNSSLVVKLWQERRI